MMDKSTRNAAIAAAIIMAVFGFVGYFLPAIIVAAGAISPFVGGAIAGLFVLAFFGVFWLRGRSRGSQD